MASEAPFRPGQQFRHPPTGLVCEVETAERNEHPEGVSWGGAYKILQWPCREDLVGLLMLWHATPDDQGIFRFNPCQLAITGFWEPAPHMEEVQ